MRPIVIALSLLSLTGCPSPAQNTVVVETPDSSQSPSREADAAFDAKKWEDAAALYAKLIVETEKSTGKTSALRERFAECLYHLGMPRLAWAAFESAGDARTKVGLRWLARLSMELPFVDGGPAISAHSEATRKDVIATLDEAEASRAHYHLGVALEREGKLEEAITELELVKGSDAARAHIRVGIAHVKNRKAVPAVAAFRRARELASEMKDTEGKRLVDLALVEEARVYFSAAQTVDTSAGPNKGATKVDGNKLAAALKAWSAIDPAGELYREVSWEAGWAYVSAGDLDRALKTVDDALAGGAFLPEARYLRGAVLHRKGDKKAASEQLVSTIRELKKTSAAVRARADAAASEDADAVILAFTKDVAKLPDDIRPAVASAVDGRDVQNRAAELAAIVSEGEKANALSESFKGSGAGGLVLDLLEALEPKRAELKLLLIDRLQRAVADIDANVEKARQELQVADPKAFRSDP